MTTNDIMDYMRKKLSQICNDQVIITEILCELQEKLEYLEDDSFINGQNNILRKVWSA